MVVSPRCYDCGLSYDDDGFPDLVLPNDTWAAISPTGDEGGMLCPSCICRRLAQGGFQDVPAVFRSGSCCVYGKSGVGDDTDTTQDRGNQGID